MVTSKPDTEDVANRRAQLRRWIKDHYPNQAAFVAATKINQGELSALLKNKSFGEKRARSLERAAKMPEKYLEQRAGTAAAKNGTPSLSAALRAPSANEPAASYSSWPFKQVTPEQYAKLSLPERLAVEQIVALFLARRGVQTPATKQLIHALS